ncbi:hypothetical protein BDV11DRAFT_169189 [Aspergillus similis]
MEHGTEFLTALSSNRRGGARPVPQLQANHAKENECRYCVESRDEDSGLVNVIEPCPTDRSMRASFPTAKNPFWQTAFWSFKGSGKEAGFYNLLFGETRITKEKQSWTLRKEKYGLGPNHGVPAVTKGFDEDVITDPQDIIAELLGSVGMIKEELEIALVSIRVGSARSWDGEEMIDAASLAVLSIQHSVESMARAGDIAEEIEEAEAKAAIMWFLTALLIFIPVGSWANTTIPRLATRGRFIGLAGEAGLVGMGLYTIVDYPNSAPFVNLEYILGGGLTDAVRITKAARARRGMRFDDIKKVGDVFANGMTKLTIS